MSSVAARHPLNTVAPYFTMFPPSFPIGALQGAAGWVLDPFCGRGTTLFASRLLGLPCVGVDSSPVAVAIASAKLVDVTPDEIVRCASGLLQDKQPSEIPSGEFWDLAYHPQTLAELCSVREGLLAASDDAPAVALRAIMLGALHGPRGKHVQSYLSNQMPRTYATKPAGAVRFWVKRDMRPEHISLLDLVRRRAERAFRQCPPPVPGRVLQSDSRTVDLPSGTGPISHVVTSPPYFGMRTYLSDQWLRLWFLGGPPEPDYSLDRQMDMSSVGAFVQELARVWQRVAETAVPDCGMSIRFGAIPSAPSSPEEIIRRSLEIADVGWRVQSVDDAGLPTHGRRQAEQFGFVRSKPIEEVDVRVVLRG